MFSAIRRYVILAAPMRLKLVLLTSLVGMLISAGAALGLAVATVGSWKAFFDPSRPIDWTVVAIYAIPLLTAVVASVFVYRHTARRRKLQSVLTGVLVLLLSLIVYIALTLGPFHI
jgi:hypothetical protein